MDIQNSELYGFLINGLKKNIPPADFAASLAALSPERWQDLLELAARQRVTSLLWHHLKQKNLDKYRAEWIDRYPGLHSKIKAVFQQ